MTKRSRSDLAIPCRSCRHRAKTARRKIAAGQFCPLFQAIQNCLHSILHCAVVVDDVVGKSFVAGLAPVVHRRKVAAERGLPSRDSWSISRFNQKMMPFWCRRS